MPSILYAASEGEIFLFQKELALTSFVPNSGSPVWADDKRRGAVNVRNGDQMRRSFTPTKNTWVRIRAAHQGAGGALWPVGTFAEIYAGGSRVFFLQRTTTYGPMEYRAFFGGMDNPDPPEGLTPTEILTFPPYVFGTHDINIAITTTTTLDDTLTTRYYRNEILIGSRVVMNPGGWPSPDLLILGPTGGSQSASNVYYQDVIITDSISTVGLELVTLVPNAQGAFSAMTNDFNSINEAGYNGNNFLIATATPQSESWTQSVPEFVLGDKSIYAVVFTNVVQLGPAGIVDDFRPFLRIAATNYNAAILSANADAPEAYTTSWVQNPATLQPWTREDIVGLEAGITAI